MCTATSSATSGRTRPPGSIQFHNFASRDVANDQPARLVGVDIHEENVRRCLHHRAYDEVYLARAEDLPFPDNFVDTVLCVEVIEHLERSAALEALAGFERIARQRVILTVPREALDDHTGRDERGFIHADTEDPEVRAYLEAERHKSAWSIRDLERLGYRVGKAVRPGWRGAVDRAHNLWLNHGWRQGQWLAVKDLRKGDVPLAAAKPTRAPRTTPEGLLDFR